MIKVNAIKSSATAGSKFRAATAAMCGHAASNVVSGSQIRVMPEEAIGQKAVGQKIVGQKIVGQTVNRVLTSGKITTADRNCFLKVALADALLDSDELDQVRQVFDRLQMGLIKVVD